LIGSGFIFYKIPVESLNVDRWSVITSFWDNFFKGEYVYFAKSNMGGASSIEVGPARFDGQGNTVVTRMVSHSVMGMTGNGQTLLAVPSLAMLMNAHGREMDADMTRGRAMYPITHSNGTDRMVMLMEALVEFLEAVEGNLQHRDDTPDNRTPHAILDRLPCRFSAGGDSEKECYICLSIFEAGDVVRILPCAHEFHSRCIDKWLLDVHRTCPCCRLYIYRHAFIHIHTCVLIIYIYTYQYKFIYIHRKSVAESQIR